MASEEVEMILEETKDAMHKAFFSFQTEISRMRSGHANPALLDGVMVDYYGTPTPLRKLATVSVPEPRLIAVQPFDPQVLAGIEKSILKADLGLTPANDGRLIRVPIPELTEERRRELVKQMRRIAEEHKQSVRGSRRDGIALVKDLEKAKEVDADESRRGQKSIQSLTDENCKRIDEAAAKKEEEILTV